MNAISATDVQARMDMASFTYAQHLAGLVRDGTLKMADIDEAVRWILRIKIRMGLFEEPYAEEGKLAQVTARPEHRQEARRAAQRSIVLLKNKGGLLPLSRSVQNLAVIGSLADSRADVGGIGAIFSAKPAAITVLEGIRAKLRGATVEYAPGPLIWRTTRPSYEAMMPNLFPWKKKIEQTPAAAEAAFQEALATASKADLVEICQFHIPERGPQYIAALKQALRGADVQLLNMPIDVGNISDANPTHRAEDLAEIEEWMQVAAELGARMVRVNASMPLAPEPPAPLEVTIESYRRLARIARELGLDLLVENHGGITADPEVVIALLEGVGQDNLKLLLDIGNFEPLLSLGMALMQGREAPTVDVTPVYGAIARLAPYAHLVHAKTHEFDAAGRPLRLDVARALRVVRDAGHIGPISLEYEGSEGDPWENTRRTLALVEEVFA